MSLGITTGWRCRSPYQSDLGEASPAIADFSWTIRWPTIADMEPIVDHIQITVKDLARAIPFYDRLMPLLGFDPEKRSSAVIEEREFHVVEYSHPRLCFAITSPRASVAEVDVHRRRPGSLHHLAFRAESRAEVDRLHRELQEIGATITDPPMEYPEYTPSGYYAVFFKDPDGIKYEVMTASSES